MDGESKVSVTRTLRNSAATHPDFSSRQADGLRLVELIELVLDRGDLDFQFGGECVDSRFLELRDILDLAGGKREAPTLLEHALAGIEGFDQSNEAFEFRKPEDPGVDRHVCRSDCGFDGDQFIDFRTEILEHFVGIVVKGDGRGAGILRGEADFEFRDISSELILQLESFGDFHNVSLFWFGVKW